MYRIGILGTENSHAEAFTKIFNQSQDYPDIRVTVVGGHVAEASEKLVHDFGVIREDDPEKMLNMVDAVMVTARDGKYHSAMAMPFIKAGKPAFIDKPFTVDRQEALELIRFAQEKKVPLVGGSSLKYCADTLALKEAFQTIGEVHGGTVTAPLDMINEYSGFFFYSSHLAEICLTIFGYDPVAVSAFEKKGNVTAVVHYDAFDVSCHYMDGCYQYFGAVYGKDKLESRSIDMSDCYRLECDAFAKMLRTGEMPHSYEHLAKPVDLLIATKESYETGKTVCLPK